jgi:GntR family transcriptional regulator
MDIVIEINSPEPVYVQIVQQIQEGVKSGRLSAGKNLPPVRQLADDLEVNRNTVARAYKILEEQGVILTAGRKGTFVRDNGAEEAAKAKSHDARNSMRRLIEKLRMSGLSREEIMAEFRQALAPSAQKGGRP